MSDLKGLHLRRLFLFQHFPDAVFHIIHGIAVNGLSQVGGCLLYTSFRNQGSEFVITTPHTPRHWYNYLYNDSYITFTSQVGYGESLIQGHLGRRILLADSRQVYILDTESGQYWTANGLPVKKEYQDFSCVHGIGYTEIFSQYMGISSSFRIFVPQDANEEIWSIKVKNTSNRIRTIKVIPYAKTETDGCLLYTSTGNRKMPWSA